MAKGRIMTLRGTIPVDVGTYSTYGFGNETQLFDYQSPDRKKSWRVRYAAAWWATSLTGTGGGDNRSMVQLTLATDTLGGAPGISSGATARAWQEKMSPADNRTIAWLVQDYQNRDNTNADFVCPGAGWSLDFTCDFDRIITNELWITSFAVTEGSALTGASAAQFSYYIELEELKTSAAESLFQQLKGMGQDIQG